MLLAPASGQTEQLKGSLRLQYQTTDGPSGNRSFLARSIEVDHATQWRRSLDIRSRLEFRQSSVMEGPAGTVTPYGSIQITHNIFGLMASYRPTTVTDGRGTKMSSQQTVLNAHFGMPKLPRVDMSWTRRHRGAIFPQREGTGTTRSVRLSHDLGRLEWHGGYGDQASDAFVDQTTQRSYALGGSGQAIARGPASLMLQYDFNRSTQKARAVSTHNGSANGGYKLSTKSDVSLNYVYRRSEMRSSYNADLNDHDGAALLNYRPTSGTRLMAGAGLHTFRTADQEELVRNLIAAASASGRVRPGWKGQAGVARTMNWSAEGRRYAVDNWNGSSSFQLAPRLELNATMLATANSDTAGAENNHVAQISYGVTASPIRSFRVVWRDGWYRSGPGFFNALAKSRSNTLDLRWTPLKGLDMFAVFSRASALTAGSSVGKVSRYSLKWSSFSKIQLDANYSKSTARRSDLGLDGLVGQESMGFRLLMAPERRTRVSAGMNIADPGLPTRTEQIDLTLTRSFGS